MEQTVVTASSNRELGSSSSRRLRSDGRLPGVVYGLGKDPVNVHVSYLELREALKTDAGLNTVFKLDVDGQQDLVLVKEVQRHPIRAEVLHVDFLRIDATKSISVDVPVHLVGEATAVEEAGLLVDQLLFSLTVECAPSAIPDSLQADITELASDRNITVGDISLPPGVTTPVDADAPVVSTAVPRAAVEEEAEEKAEIEGADEADVEEAAEASADDSAGEDDAGE